MIVITLALCAVLSGVTLAYIMASKLREKHSGPALAGVFVLAGIALVLYLLAGSPGFLSKSPDQAAREQLATEETAIMAALEKNPDDAQAMIRLAALQVYRGENNAATLDLLDRAEKQLPGDRRIPLIRSMAASNPEP